MSAHDLVAAGSGYRLIRADFSENKFPCVGGGTDFACEFHPTWVLPLMSASMAASKTFAAETPAGKQVPADSEPVAVQSFARVPASGPELASAIRAISCAEGDF
jgi:hypothetical protein